MVGSRTICASTCILTLATGWLAWEGWTTLRGDAWRAIRAGQAELVGPIVVGFVLFVFGLEQLWPAQRRPIRARGQVIDLAYLALHAMLVVPLIILIGTGFSAVLARAAPWLVLPPLSPAPRWLLLSLVLVAVDATDWLVHLANHKISALWRLHALHHSQEELSIFSAFRTHPFVHLSFVVSAIPTLALAANAATPDVALTGLREHSIPRDDSDTALPRVLLAQLAEPFWAR